MLDPTCWKSKPLDFVDNLYAVSNGDNDCLKKEIMKTFQSCNMNELPLLNVSPTGKIPRGHLIRVVGMVQDMFDPEVYVEHFTVIQEDNKETLSRMQFGRYRDSHQLNPTEKVDETSVKLSERQAFYLVPIPGVTSWVKKELSRECHFVGVSSCGSKRNFEESLVGFNSIECEDGCHMETEGSVDGVVNKKFKDAAGSDKEIKMSQPIHKRNEELDNQKRDKHDGACLVQVYEKFEDIKLNDLIEVIGIYHPIQEELLSSQQPDTDGFEFSNPVQSLRTEVPQVHAVLIHRLPHCNPLLPRNIFDSVLIDSHIGAPISEIRDYLFATLLDALLGDSLAAEYLLLHIISSVGKQSLGSKSHLTLNLSRCKPELQFPSYLFSLLSELLSTCLPVELSLNSLATAKEPHRGGEFYPVRDVDTGRLHSGLLQVPNRTEILVDETCMSEGHLESRACLNLNALMSVAGEQELPYDFQFYTRKYDTDVMLLILSQSRSIIKGCVEVAWSPCDPVIQEDTDRSSNEGLCQYSVENVYTQLLDRLKSDSSGSRDSNSPIVKMRQYLTVLPLRNKGYEISAELQDRINEDFVRLRREDTQWMTVDQFKFMLDLLQLETLSYGDKEASVSLWEKVIRMEVDRKQRLDTK